MEKSILSICKELVEIAYYSLKLEGEDEEKAEEGFNKLLPEINLK